MGKDIPILPYQLKALQSTSDEILLLGGIATGKSVTGAMWVLNKIIENPGCDILLVANTYSQLMTASVRTLTLYLDKLNIPYKSVLSGARKRVEIGSSTIFLYSLEKYDSIRGIEVSFIWADEIAYSCLEALNVIRGRRRSPKTDYRQSLFTTSGNGFNFLYDVFGNLQKGSDKQLIEAMTKENIFLPEGEYERMLDNYGGDKSPLARQELFGEFVNLQEGAIYNMFDRGMNVKECTLNKNFPVYVGVDFNIDQMSATYMQFIHGRFYQCKEVQLTHRNANTRDLGLKILEDLNGYNVQIVPDSTGKARKTSANSSASDHQILRELGLIVMTTSNPRIRDRQNNLNIKFSKGLLTIDPSCIKTIKEIETLASRDIEGKVSHLSVTTGYVCWLLAPLKKTFNNYSIQL